MKNIISYTRKQFSLQFSILMCLSLLILGSQTLQAQCISTVVPFDNSTSAGFRGLNPNDRRGIVVYLITAGEMAAAGYTNGTSLMGIGGSFTTAPSITTTGSLQVYLENSIDVGNTKSTTWATAIAPMTQVYNNASHTVTTALSWNLTFGSSFTYTGGSLYVAMEWTNCGTPSTLAVVACNSTGLIAATKGTQSTTACTALATTAANSAFRGVTTFTTNVTDIAVKDCWAQGKTPMYLNSPQLIGGAISNTFATTQNVNATFTVKEKLSGAIRYTASQAVSIPGCSMATITNNAWSPTIAETDSVILTTTPIVGEALLNNNKQSKEQLVNKKIFDYGVLGGTSTGTVGYNTGSGLLLSRYNLTGTAYVDKVRVKIGAGTGNTVYGVVVNSAGTIVGQSANYVIQAGDINNYVTFTIPTQPSFTNTTFYVGMAQTANVVGYFPWASTNDAVRQPTTLYTAAIGGGALTELTNLSSRFWQEAEMVTFTSVISGTSTICDGNSTNLVVNITGGTGPYNVIYTDGLTNMVESNYTSGSPISVAPSTTTTYTLVSVTDANNSEGTDYSGSAIITVNPTPTATITGPTTVCEGSSVTLAASTNSNVAVNGLHFNGGGHINVTNVANIPIGNSPYTIEAWIKPTAANFDGIAGWGTYGSNNQVNAFRTTGPTQMTNYWWANDLTVNVPNLSDGNWHHVVATYDGTTRAIYTDGILRGSDTPAGHNVSTASNLTVGYACNNCAGNDFNGDMDELRIWNVGRTQAEILSTMGTRIPTNSAGLGLYYRMDESSGGTTLNDNNNATNTGPLGPGMTRNIPSTAPIFGDYLWSTSSTAANISVSPITTTNYTVTVTSLQGCQNSATQTVVVNTRPTSVVSGGGTVCSGSTLPNVGIALTGTGPWTFTYTDGTTPTTITGTSSNPYTIAAATAGTYTVTALNDANCTATGPDMTGSAIVVVNPLPSVTATASPTPLCDGANLTLSGTSNVISTSYSPASAIPYSPTTPSGAPTILSSNGVATPALTSGSLDDGYWNNLALPFNITFFGNSYSTFRVSTNGNIQFGALNGSTPAGFNPTSNAIPTAGGQFDNYIGSPWMDLDLRNTAGTTQLDYYTEGVSPNRTFIVRWRAKIYNAVDRDTAQIEIHEGSNIIDVYVAATATTLPKSLGIENNNGTEGYTAPGLNVSTSNIATNQGWRFVPSATSPFAWTGPNAYTSAAKNPGVFTVSSLSAGTYTLTVTDPSTGCIGSASTAAVVVNPNPTSVVSGGGTVCDAAPLPNVNVALTGTGPWTFTYTNGSTPTTITGTSTNPYVIANATAGTYTVTTLTDANCTSQVGGNTGSASVVVNLTPVLTSTATPSTICSGQNAALLTTVAPLSFCQPTYSFGTGGGDFCTLVNITGTTLHNTTGASPSPYYTLYPQSDSTTTTLTAGSSYSLVLSVGTYTNNDIAAWIDYNRNGKLDDLGEKLGETDNLGANGSTTINFTVPVGAVNGTLRLRVRELDHASSNDITPCNVQSSYGEVEDYDITITGGVAPFTYSWSPATFLNATNIANPTATAATATTNYNVMVTSAANCSASSPVTLTVDPLLPAPTLTSSTNTPCANTQFTLTATAAGGYTGVEYLWYKNGTLINWGYNNTYVVNAGNTAGSNDYTVQIYYSGFVCSSNNSATITITVMAPTATITPAGPTTFCANTPTTLNANAGMANYVWKRSATIVQSGASASYIPTASGNHTVTVTDASGCSKTSAFVAITVKAIPIANAGVDKNVCEGTSVQIGVNPVVGNTYNWSPPTALSNATIANPMASPSSTTTYTVTVTNTASTCSNTDAVLLTSLAAPSAPSISSTATPVCQGSSISITPTSVGAASINWYKNGTLLYNKPTNYIALISAVTASSDAYHILAKGANGCLSGTSNVINAWIKEAAVPIMSSTPAAVGNSINVCVPGGTTGTATLTASSTTPSPSYSWKQAGNFIPGANTNTYMATVTTTQNHIPFNVEATYPNGCVKASLSKTVRLITSGCTPKLGEGKDEAELLINNEFGINSYPNPTTGILNVEIINNETSTGKIVLSNALGQIVLEKTIILSNGQANEELNLNHLAAGVYSLSFQTEKDNHVQKVIKE